METFSRIELKGIVGNVNTTTIHSSRLTRLSLATSYAYKGKGGSPVIETTWHNVIVWDNPIAENARRGDQLHVVGRLRAQTYVDSEGVDRVAFEVVANQVDKID